MATRVALHPFLVGMNRRQLALLDSTARWLFKFKKDK